MVRNVPVGYVKGRGGWGLGGLAPDVHHSRAPHASQSLDTWLRCLPLRCTLYPAFAGAHVLRALTAHNLPNL